MIVEKSPACSLSLISSSRSATLFVIWYHLAKVGTLNGQLKNANICGFRRFMKVLRPRSKINFVFHLCHDPELDWHLPRVVETSYRGSTKSARRPWYGLTMSITKFVTWTHGRIRGLQLAVEYNMTTTTSDGLVKTMVLALIDSACSDMCRIVSIYFCSELRHQRIF